jgi:hypothetical protein
MKQDGTEQVQITHFDQSGFHVRYGSPLSWGAAP